jgi:hypothetical protein
MLISAGHDGTVRLWGESVPTAIEENRTAGVAPSKFSLSPAYPNPFNPRTWIPYELPYDSEVGIEIFNLAGQLVRRIELGRQGAGVYHGPGRAAEWDGRNQEGYLSATGVYLFHIQVDGQIAAGKVLLLR